MTWDLGDTVQVGLSTHYSTQFDDRGVPFAITALSDPDNIAGLLPIGWDDQFWDWQPRNDPNGQWVQKVEKYRNYLWKVVKVKRDEYKDRGVAAVVNGVGTTFDSDKESQAALSGLAERFMAPNAANNVKVVTASNVRVTLNLNELTRVRRAIADHRYNVHEWSQDVRVQIDDPANDTLEKLKAINIEYGG